MDKLMISYRYMGADDMINVITKRKKNIYESQITNEH